MGKRVLTCWLLVVWSGGVPTEAQDGAELVSVAIDGIRGVELNALTQDEGRALEQRLHRTLELFEKHPEESLAAIRAALTDETEDGFLLIELSQLYMILRGEEASPIEIAEWVERADPRAFPDGFFNLAAQMAAANCTDCLGAAQLILRFDEMRAYIPRHALEVDLDLGLLFVLGPYGTKAEGLLRAKLSGGNCQEQRNAARMLTFLAPRELPEELEMLALGDACLEARGAAWRSIGALGHHKIGALVLARLEGAPTTEEQLAMVDGLGGVYFPHVIDSLRVLSGSANEEVAAAASMRLNELVELEVETGRLREGVGSAEAAEISKTRDLLRRAAATGQFSFEGSEADFRAQVEVSDLELLNSAKAAVLARQSDECLYEFSTLFQTARLLRQMASNSLGSKAP